jgi:hypothetical protein
MPALPPIRVAVVSPIPAVLPIPVELPIRAAVVQPIRGRYRKGLSRSMNMVK